MKFLNFLKDFNDSLPDWTIVLIFYISTLTPLFFAAVVLYTFAQAVGWVVGFLIWFLCIYCVVVDTIDLMKENGDL